jgi:hypothetical protein
MALSGSFTGITNNQYIQPKITWSAAQDIAGNFSTVTATLTYSRTNDYTTSGKWSGSITINETTTNYSTSNAIVITQDSDTVAMSATVKVPHDNDGKKSVYISCTGGMTDASVTLKTTSCASNITLDSIPRQATITSAPDIIYDTDNPTITFSNPANVPMDVWLEPNPVGDHLCIKNDIENTGSYTWTLTDAEREQLRNKCTGKSSCTIRLGLYSYLNGVEYADYKDKTFVMSDNPATKPSVAMEITLNNGSLPSKFADMCIQGKSRLNINLTAQGKYGASITNYSASVDGKTYYTSSFTTDAITKSGDVDIVASAKDTRGFTGTTTSEEINVIAYSKPLVIPIGNENAILCYRSDGNGVRIGNSTSVWIKAKRFYYNLSGKNACALQWRRRLITEAWDDSKHSWKDLIAKGTTSINEYNALISGGDEAVFDLKKSYAVQIRATDDIGEYDIKEFEIPTQDVALHLGKGGKNVSVGTYCDYSEEYTFYSAWKAIFDKGVYIGEDKYPLNDFVIERGTDGIWTYEKRASGDAICRGIYVQENVAIKTPWGIGLFESAGYKVDLPSGLFIATPQFNITLTGSNGTFLQTYSEGTTERTPYMCAVRPEETTVVQKLNTAITAHGRWK